MKKFLSLWMAVIFLTGLVMTAEARESERGTTAGASQQGTGAGAAGMNFKGLHNMTGTVTQIDKDKDIVHVKTDEGTLTVHLPGASKDLKEGDAITVRLGYMKGEHKAGTAGQGTTSGQGSSTERSGTSEQSEQSNR